MTSIQPLIAATIYTGFLGSKDIGTVAADVLAAAQHTCNVPDCELCQFAGLGVNSGLSKSAAMLTYGQIAEFAEQLIAGSPEPLKRHIHQAMMQFYYYKNKQEAMLTHLTEYKTLYGEDRAYLNARIGYVWLRLIEGDTPELLAELDELLVKAKLAMEGV